MFQVAVSLSFPREAGGFFWMPPSPLRNYQEGTAGGNGRRDGERCTYSTSGCATGAWQTCGDTGKSPARFPPVSGQREIIRQPDAHKALLASASWMRRLSPAAKPKGSRAPYEPNPTERSLNTATSVSARICKTHGEVFPTAHFSPLKGNGTVSTA